MATAETVDLGVAHAPKEESFVAFKSIESEFKKELQHLRYETNKHESEYFAAVKNLSDEQLTDFSSKDLVLVRLATSAYGMHLFGKVKVGPASSNTYVHIRIFIGGGGEAVKFHSIQTQEIDGKDGSKTFRAIFSEKDPLDWFDA